MRFQGLDLNLLVALDALFTDRNVTTAASRVHLSQSAMSGALARLREYFEDELFVQIGRKLVLTPLAEELVQPIRDILLQVDATITTNPKFDPATSTRNFSIAASDYTVTVLLTRLLRCIHAAAPAVTFEIALVNEHSFDDLRQGDIDFLFMPKEFLIENCANEPVFFDTYVCVVSADSDLNEETLTLERYLASGHVVVRHGAARVPTLEEEFLQQHGHPRKIEVVAPSFSLLPQLVAGTPRIATLPRRLAMLYARYLPLRLVEAPVKFPEVQCRVQWHKYRDRDPGFLWFRSMLREVAQGAWGASGGIGLPDAAWPRAESRDRPRWRGRRG